MDRHTQAQVARLMQELVSSSAGSALRRVAFKSRADTLLPPAPIRSQIVKNARASFKRSVATLSVASLAAAVLASARRMLRSRREYDTCEAFPEGAQRDACNATLDKRRRRIMQLLLRSKLRVPQGLLSAAAVVVLLTWAAITGTIAGVFDGIRRRLVRALGGVVPDSDAPPPAPIAPAATA